MKLLSIFLLWVIPASILWAETDSLYQDGTKYRARVEKEFRVSPGGRFTIENISGDVSVVGTSDTKIVIEENLIFYTHSRSNAREMKEEYKCRYRQTGNTLIVEGPGKSSRKVNTYYEIKAPTIFSVMVSTSGGDIDVETITGDISVFTSGGDLDLLDIAGKIYAETSGGDISVKNGQGTFSVKTSGGDIEIENIEGSMDVETSGGDLDIVGVNGSAKFKTFGGDINLEEMKGESFEAKTLGGFIRAENIIANLDLFTSGGDIDGSDILGNLKASTSGGDIGLNSINGNIDVHTSGGDIEALEIMGSLDASTSGGDIRASKSFTDDFPDNHITLKTSGGEIALYISENARVTVDAFIRTSRSRFDYFKITSEFPLTITRDYDSREEIRASGDINGGGDLIQLQTSNGDIQIKRKR